MDTENRHLDDKSTPTWERLLSGEGGLVFDLLNGIDSDILALTRLGIFRSMDQGIHWARIEAPPLARVLHHSGGWWLGTDIGLFRADQLDGRWVSLLPQYVVIAILVDEQSNLILAATSTEGLLRTEDMGASWEDGNPGLAGDEIVAICKSPAYQRDRAIFLATSSGMFRSRNGGRAWRPMSIPFEDIECFTVSGQQMFVGTGSDGIWTTNDEGRTWHQILQGVAIRAFHTTSTDEILVVSDCDLISINADGRQQGTVALPIDTICATRSGSSILVGTAGRGVTRYLPQDACWEDSSLGLQATSRDRVLAVEPSWLVTTSSTGGVLLSTDWGSTWAELPPSPLQWAIDFAARSNSHSSLEIAACDGRLAARFDRDWRRLAVEFPIAVAWVGGELATLTSSGEFACGDIRSKVIDGRMELTGARIYPASGNPALIWLVLHTLHAGTFLIRSGSGGNQWEPLFQTNSKGAVSFALDVSPSGEETALVAIGNKIFDVLKSPMPLWNGDEGIEISAMSMTLDDRVLIATNRGFWEVSTGFMASQKIAGSPSQLLDVEAAPDGSAIVVEQGGAVWRVEHLSDRK